jgi:hypothetical protein
MITLEDSKEKITNFIIDSIEAFKIQNGKFTSIGVYCCPWMGWISMCFNVDKALSATGYNCPDFDVVEFKILGLDSWEEEYENGSPAYKLNDQTIELNIDSGDEVLNELVFKFLSNIILRIKDTYNEHILLQMLDSKFLTIL